jgi:hypothetical protein
MERRVPKYLLALLTNWYSKLTSCVKWGNITSKDFKITSGIRQGGILSPNLFALYVEDILAKLNVSGLGCYIRNVCFNALMYADDLVLLSISITDLQMLLNLCVEEFSKIKMEINIKKSECLRVGRRQRAKVLPVIVNSSVCSGSSKSSILVSVSLLQPILLLIIKI